jgi:hypothetical protein
MSPYTAGNKVGYQGRNWTVKYVADDKVKLYKPQPSGEPKEMMVTVGPWLTTPEEKVKKIAWYKDSLFKDKLLGNLGKGKDSAKTQVEFLKDAELISAAEAEAFSKVDTFARSLRKAEEFWRSEGVPVISCTSGIFLAENDQEITEYKAGLKANADARYRTAGLNLVVEEE